MDHPAHRVEYERTEPIPQIKRKTIAKIRNIWISSLSPTTTENPNAFAVPRSRAA